MDKMMHDKMKEISLFAEIKDSRESMEKLEALVKIRRYARDEIILREGDCGGEMFIVYKGNVEIRKKTRAGDDYTVARLSADQNVFFGELSLIDDDMRSATVVATSDCECLAIAKSDFLSLGRRCPDIALPITQAIARMLAARMRKTTQDMLALFDALVNEVG